MKRFMILLFLFVACSNPIELIHLKADIEILSWSHYISIKRPIYGCEIWYTISNSGTDTINGYKIIFCLTCQDNASTYATHCGALLESGQMEKKHCWASLPEWSFVDTIEVAGIELW